MAIVVLHTRTSKQTDPARSQPFFTTVHDVGVEPFHIVLFLETYAVQAKESSSAANRSISGSASEMAVTGKSGADSTEVDSTSTEGPLE
ncbi:hypothetical protein FKV24_010605 [Lysobacter maris]|uniref:Uncharacterized protein n=1 Tax=Marilutibacter maris TaxID=1605891 RepID=A0A508ASH9_9GAMM|nr:hypothetical protein [Lysobacter maris]KAB8185680.1 hypothetical protein FKV24_010605 [Lysobacter maris]